MILGLVVGAVIFAVGTAFGVAIYRIGSSEKWL